MKEEKRLEVKNRSGGSNLTDTRTINPRSASNR
jgi:hypothetical protein